MHFSIIGYNFLGLLAVGLAIFVVRLTKYNREPHEFDMSRFGKMIGYGGPLDPGDPEMVTKLEEKLKKESKK